MNRKYLFLGIFMVVSLGLLGWLAVNIGAIGGKQGNLYIVKLDHAAGIVQDNAVKVAGVKVGRVESVKVDYKTAVLHLRVDPDVELHTDTEAIVRAKSLLGEKYLQLDPGSLDAPRLKDGAQIERVQTVFEIDEMLNALEPVLGGEDSIGAVVQPLIKRLDGMLAAANGDDGGDPVVTRDEIQQSIEDIRVSIETTRRILETNEKPINDLVVEANALISDPKIKRTLNNVDKIAATTAEHLPTLLAKAERALDAVDRVAAELTPERMEKVGEILDDAAVAVENLRKVSDELVGVTGDLGPMLKNLALIVKRAASIDELALRQFIQKEGMRVNLSVPKNARDRIDSLEDDAGQ